MTTLTPAYATQFVRIALGHVEREYPNKLDHALTALQDLHAPRELHPIFYGSYDWHSCVHSYWLLARALRRYPDLQLAPRIVALFDRNLTEAKVASELAYLTRSVAFGFERPYGWAWLLRLTAELRSFGSEAGSRWAGILTPLAEAFAGYFWKFMATLTYPVRAGTHHNTAFALVVAAEYAQEMNDRAALELLASRATHWFGGDHEANAWEPSGEDFLSPVLVEATCMSRFMGQREFMSWFDDFFPELSAGEPRTLFEPASVSDRSDGQIAHLDGLNLSRAWCMRMLAANLPEPDARRRVLLEASQRHLAAALPHIAVNYMGEHWLSTYAMLALDGL